jgi:formylglycine-generating enzyme required for sulfatase activity
MASSRFFLIWTIQALIFLTFSLSLHAEEQETITGKDGAEMVIIPGGSFSMGSKEPDMASFTYVHKVDVDVFYMDKYEVTNSLFADFLNSVKPDEKTRKEWIVLRGDLDTEERKNWWPTEIIFIDGIYKAFNGFENFPVITPGWFAADAYCRWAGERLPTEAEWEKAARGGLKEKNYTWGNEIPTGGIIFGRQWHNNHEPAPTERVGNYFPNGYGLYDMAGNVWEWCSDWYDPKYYEKSPDKNPKGPTKGDAKVLRGGSWYNTFLLLRVAYRNFSPPMRTDDAVGFRCVKDMSNEK